MFTIRNYHIRLLAVFLSVLSGTFLYSQNLREEDDRPKRRIPLLSAFVSGSYFAPKLSDVDGVYEKIEHAYNLPQGGAFKTYYTVSAGLRVAPVSLQLIELEVVGTLFKARPSIEGNSSPPTNFIRTYALRGSYVVNVPLQPYIFIQVGAGAGALWLRTERTYPARVIAHVNGELLELHTFLGAELFYLNGTSVMFRVGYSYATTVYPTHTECDFTMKGATVNIGFHIPLVRI
ncbi:MAG: hypothetical protein N3A63_09970 [Bacteroidetes bacterium]|nr:hypothetical protein [Bacteroidota bacterium]